MESSDSIDKSWDTSSDMTTTAQHSDPLASAEPPAPIPHGWMVNVAGRDIVEMPHADVMAKVRSGEISTKSLVWREGMESWAVLETVPAFQIVSRPPPSASPRSPAPPRETVKAKDAPAPAEEVNPVAVYERPVATLVFAEGVESEWKAPEKAREPSKSTRGSVSSRPPAPSFPPLAPPRLRSSPSVPHDEPPPPPPLPPHATIAAAAARASTAPAAKRASAAPAALVSASPAARVSTTPEAPRATIPGGLAAPEPRATSSAPPVRPSAGPARTSASPLLSAIAAAASNPAPVVVNAPVPQSVPPSVPVPAIAAPLPSASTYDEVSFGARLFPKKSVPFKTAAIACAASALVASLVTGLVAGSRVKVVTVPGKAPPAVTVTVVAPAPPPPAPAATAAADSKSDATEKPSGEQVTLGEAVAEKPKKPAQTKVRAWKPPAAEGSTDGTSTDTREATARRDNPEKAVPDPAARSDKPENWHENPGF